jgi:hypothetical protein
MKNKRIAVNIVDGYHVRFFIETGIVEKLANSGNEIILIVPDYHIEDIRHVLSSNISYQKTPGVSFGFIEKALMYVYSGTFRARFPSQRHEFIYRRKREGQSLSYNLQFCFRYITEKHLSKLFINSNWIKKIVDYFLDRHSKKCLAFLKKLRPDIFVSSSPGFKFLDISLLKACNHSNIPTICPVLSWDNLSTKGPMLAHVDRLIVWNHQLAQDAISQHGYEPDDIDVCGAPQFDLYAKAKIDQTRERIVRKHRSIKHDYERVITFTSISPYIFPSIKEVVLRIYGILTSGAFPFKTILFIRPHPQQEFSFFSDLGKLPGIRISYPGKHSHQKNTDSGIKWQPGNNNMLQLMELMVLSDLVITIASSTTLDAAAVDTPVINIAYDPSGKLSTKRINQLYNTHHYSQVVVSKAISIAYSDKELEQQIKRQLTNPHLFSEQRRKLIESICGPVDGNSAKRQANSILKFLSGYASPMNS